MRNNVLINCYKELCNAEKIIIGLSGGADSVALTHILFTEFGSKKLICAHVNHMIRGDEAQRDEAFAKNYANSLGIEFKLCKADVLNIAERTGMGTEECGRKIRYDFFGELSENGKYLIATAHNADDNAETVIMNLIKGSGLTGLCGIPVKRGNIVRPILSLSRGQIEEHCKANNLDYIVDSTNLTDDYDRNKVRHNILPVMGEINSSAMSNINRTSDILWEDKDFIDSFAAKELIKVTGKYGLNAAMLKELHKAVSSRVILMYLKNMGCGRIENKHIESIIKAVETGSGAVSVPDNMSVYVKQNCLSVSFMGNGKYDCQDNGIELTAENTVFYGGKTLKISRKKLKNNEKVNNLLFNNCFDYDTITKCLRAGHRLQGDEITLTKRKVTKSLKKLFIEMKIPPSARDNLIVIRNGDDVLFVENVGVNAKYAVTDKTKTIGIIELSECGKG